MTFPWFPSPSDVCAPGIWTESLFPPQMKKKPAVEQHSASISVPIQSSQSGGTRQTLIDLLHGLEIILRLSNVDPRSGFCSRKRGSGGSGSFDGSSVPESKRLTF